MEKQVRLAQHVAANRLEHQYESAMRLWNVEGDPKHLRQATRITEAMARLGIVPGRVEALAADVTEGPLELGDEIPIVDPYARRASVPACSPGTSEDAYATGTSEDACATSRHAPNGDCSGDAAHGSNGDEPSAEEIAASDCPQQMIERERRQRLEMVEGLARMENRLLDLIDGQGTANSEKVASLQETLSRVRQDKATWELKLSRFAPGIQIAPLEVRAEVELAHS